MTTPTMQIRQFRTADEQELLDCWEAATRLAHEFMTDEFIAQERMNISEFYLPNTDTWVAEVDTRVVGFDLPPITST